jgi:diaminohydroxyphosphoribosylaminopyrimidine deaminase/5-amino-6-(5-phosphoribosylamino)uracil reductase
MQSDCLSTGHQFTDDESVMGYALELATRGLGYVEPNPLVGAVITDQNRRLISAGWHTRFGDAHAEVMAMADAPSTAGSCLYVTLEPCSHHGKTPPCAEAVVKAGFQRVFVGCQDPASHVSGRGIAMMRDAGLDVHVGLCDLEARELIRPFAMLHTRGRPWVHAKWAMTLDGRIAASTGHSQWISGEASRAVVHQLRGRMDAVITGAGTVAADNPRMTARPPGPRTATRVVLDSQGTSIGPESQLVQSISIAPLLVVVSDSATDKAVDALKATGAEVARLSSSAAGRICVDALLGELGSRGMTNVLIEAGCGILGSFFDARLIDEVHVFVAPKLVGGVDAFPVIGGEGRQSIPTIPDLTNVEIRRLDNDTLIHGRINRVDLPEL